MVEMAFNLLQCFGLFFGKNHYNIQKDNFFLTIFLQILLNKYFSRWEKFKEIQIIISLIINYIPFFICKEEKWE